LTDPPTTPATPSGQLQFAAVAAVVSVLMFLWVGGPAYLLVGLLAGNLWTLWMARQRAAKAVQGKTAAPQVGADRTLGTVGWAARLMAAGTLTAVLVLNARTTPPPRATAAPSALLVGQWSGTVHTALGTGGSTVLGFRARGAAAPWR